MDRRKAQKLKALNIITSELDLLREMLQRESANDPEDDFRMTDILLQLYQLSRAIKKYRDDALKEG